jgi:DNA repair ATPase RecN
MSYFLNDDEKDQFKEGLKIRIQTILDECDTITGGITAIREQVAQKLASRLTDELLQNLTIIIPADTVIKLKTSTGSVTAFTITEDVTAARIKVD